MTQNKEIGQNLRGWLTKQKAMQHDMIEHQQALVRMGGDAQWAKDAVAREQLGIENLQKSITYTEHCISLADQERLVDPDRG